MIEQINGILKRELPRLKTKAIEIAPYKHYASYLSIYTDKGHGLIITLFHRGEKVFIRSILRKTGAWKTSWLINGQPSTGTKNLKFWGESNGPEINL